MVKKIIGWFILINIIPVIFGLTTIDGEFCYHGECEIVIPFFGGYLIGLSIIGVSFILIGLVFLIFKFIIDGDCR